MFEARKNNKHEVKYSDIVVKTNLVIIYSSRLCLETQMFNLG